MIPKLAPDPDLPLSVVAELTRRRQPLLTDANAAELVDREMSTLSGLGIVDQILARSDVNEVMINGAGRVWIELNGRLELVASDLDADELDLIIERMLSPLGLRLDRLNPIVDARLPDGSRVNVVAPPLAVDGPLVAVRRFTSDVLPLDAFGPPELARVLIGLVEARKSILVVGATSTGKTTLLNSLSRYIDPRDRVVIIEDTAELRLEGKHLVRLEARAANSEGVGEVSMRRLVTTALRLRPDRLVVGEVRGAEAFDLLLALTAGHAGSLCTCHALDASAGLRRLQMLAALADSSLAPQLIGQFVNDAIDNVVHVDRVDGRRMVESVWVLTEPTRSSPPADLSPGPLRAIWRRQPDRPDERRGVVR